MRSTFEYFDPASLDDAGLGVRSVDIILAGQAESGAFIASPNFATYRYAWLRDGAYCARALDVVGRTAEADRFHRWVERTLLRHRAQAESAIEDLGAGRLPEMERMLPTRYALDGDLEHPLEDDDEPWPNFQLDGYGTWLHELGAHQMRADSTDFDAEAVELAARYLAAAWDADCYDCWEEFGDGQHASTLAAIAAGLRAAARLLDNPAFLRVADEVVASLHANFVRDGYLRKGATDDRVDASLLSIALPLQVFAVDDPIMQKTAGFIRRDLRGPTGGVYRYLGDTYFGGGEWILLTAWLGWYDVSAGDKQGFSASRDWVRERVTGALELPEQTTDGVQDPTMTEPWVRRWGPVATPLLWSHAMYLLLSEASHKCV